jgi:hypothetical protein
MKFNGRSDDRLITQRPFHITPAPRTCFTPPGHRYPIRGINAMRPPGPRERGAGGGSDLTIDHQGISFRCDLLPPRSIFAQNSWGSRSWFVIESQDYVLFRAERHIKCRSAFKCSLCHDKYSYELRSCPPNPPTLGGIMGDLPPELGGWGGCIR